MGDGKIRKRFVTVLAQWAGAEAAPPEGSLPVPPPDAQQCFMYLISPTKKPNSLSWPQANSIPESKQQLPASPFPQVQREQRLLAPINAPK